ncbi:MAG: two-component regulator propeller domain-containing protein [Candidatus Kapaibacteriota bacterium]
MQKFFSLFTICIILLSFELFSQNSISLTNWKVFSSQVNILSGDIDNEGNLWCATNGGVFHFNPKTNANFTSFNSLNGLYSIDSKFLTFNRLSNEIYMGTFDGVLSIYSPSSGWENILDIKNSQFTNVEINHILFQDTIAYISGGFGFTSFDTRKKVFLKTPSRLGNFPSGTRCNYSISFNNYLWIATEIGIARIRIGEKITNPNAWENFTETSGLTKPYIYFLAVDDTILYAFGQNIIYKFVANSFTTFLTLETYEKILNVQVFNGKIYFATQNFVADLNLNRIYFINESPMEAKINGFVFLNDNEVAIFLNKSGLVIKNLKTSKLDYFLPKTPISNQFKYFDIDASGGFWSATSPDPSGEGLMYMKDGNWINFTTFLNPAIKTNNLTKVTCVGDTAFVSSWGSGLYAIYPSSDTFVIKQYDNNNSLLTGIPANPNYVVVEQTAYDNRYSLLWIVNYSDAKMGYLLVAKDRNGKFHGFIPTPLRKYHNILIDEFGTKWISSKDGTGFYFFNERGTLEDTTDDVYGNLIWSINLPSNTIYTMAYDFNGYIWCGTGNGIFLILNPNAVLNNSTPVVKKLKMLEDYSINCIYIDPLNYKWIATNKGVFVVSPDGSDILLTLTKDNSPLLSNDVQYITSNPFTGDFYFGTTKGLVIASSMNVQPLDKYEISVFPQPLFLPKQQQLLIDGLAMDSEIKILTIDGEIVRTFTTHSKRTFWDGKDYNGNFVSTGVYIIVAKSQSTKESAVHKIAVIKE